MISKVTDIAYIFMKEKIKEGDIIVDATCGNGNDTLSLSDLAGKNGEVYAFDIQSKAVRNTERLLGEKAEYKNYKVIRDSFVNIDKYIDRGIDCAVYNLGYLPGGDKSITTNKDDTIESLEKILCILNKSGVIIISSYRGHLGGKEEYDSLLDFFKILDKQNYDVLHINHINRNNNSPVVFIIEKSKKSNISQF